MYKCKCLPCRYKNPRLVTPNLSRVVYACNPSSGEAEIGGPLRFTGHPPVRLV